MRFHEGQWWTSVLALLEGGEAALEAGQRCSRQSCEPRRMACRRHAHASSRLQRSAMAANSHSGLVKQSASQRLPCLTLRTLIWPLSSTRRLLCQRRGNGRSIQIPMAAGLPDASYLRVRAPRLVRGPRAAKLGTLEEASLLRSLNLHGRGKAQRRRGHVAKVDPKSQPGSPTPCNGAHQLRNGPIREVVSTETRRSGAMLMLYLTHALSPHGRTRPSAGEPVARSEHPGSAVNSLDSETLFHLRRDIEPWY